MYKLKMAEFGIGEIIHHKHANYRGVIIDVDAKFEGTDRWYNTNVAQKTPKNEPWYRILIDQQGIIGYVAEKNLEHDKHQQRYGIDHPLVEDFFTGMKKGIYQHRQAIN